MMDDDEVARLWRDRQRDELSQRLRRYRGGAGILLALVILEAAVVAWLAWGVR